MEQDLHRTGTAQNRMQIPSGSGWELPVQEQTSAMLSWFRKTGVFQGELELHLEWRV